MVDWSHVKLDFIVKQDLLIKENVPLDHIVPPSPFYQSHVRLVRTVPKMELDMKSTRTAMSSFLPTVLKDFTVHQVLMVLKSVQLNVLQDITVRQVPDIKFRVHQVLMEQLSVVSILMFVKIVHMAIIVLVMLMLDPLLICQNVKLDSIAQRVVPNALHSRVHVAITVQLIIPNKIHYHVLVRKLMLTAVFIKMVLVLLNVNLVLQVIIVLILGSFSN